MFDIGFTEILMIGVVAFVVIGPERLPDVARTAGHWIGKLQRFVSGVKKDLASELETGDLKKLIGDQREQLDELRKMVDTTQRDINTSTKSLMSDTKQAVVDLEQTIKAADAGTSGSASGQGSEASRPVSGALTSGSSTPTPTSVPTPTSSSSATSSSGGKSAETRPPEKSPDKAPVAQAAVHPDDVAARDQGNDQT